jgi:hypothetical protein
MTKEEMLKLRDIFINKLTSKNYELYKAPGLKEFRMPSSYSFFNGEDKVATFACDEDDNLDYETEYIIQLYFGNMDMVLTSNKDFALIIIEQFIN